MNQQKWYEVKISFDGLEELSDGYYRIRKIETGYQLAYLIAGPCGDKVIHPEITLKYQDDQLQPVSLLDLDSTPIRRLSKENGDYEALEQATDQLLDRFLAIKKLRI
ncbi:hypothetical protein ACQKTA_07575 [Enterococcus sp. 22-H-5-01]|uniref:hypothetical protein n=1 Tax=Enterococcus sp. 22-H-5-01 TaxID=3418555 RepID=UPI003D064403